MSLCVCVCVFISCCFSSSTRFLMGICCCAVITTILPYHFSSAFFGFGIWMCCCCFFLSSTFIGSVLCICTVWECVCVWCLSHTHVHFTFLQVLYSSSILSSLSMSYCIAANNNNSYMCFLSFSAQIIITWFASKMSILIINHRMRFSLLPSSILTTTGNSYSDIASLSRTCTLLLSLNLFLSLSLCLRFSFFHRNLLIVIARDTQAHTYTNINSWFSCTLVQQKTAIHVYGHVAKPLWTAWNEEALILDIDNDRRRRNHYSPYPIHLFCLVSTCIAVAESRFHDFLLCLSVCYTSSWSCIWIFKKKNENDLPFPGSRICT